MIRIIGRSHFFGKRSKHRKLELLKIRLLRDTMFKFNDRDENRLKDFKTIIKYKIEYKEHIKNRRLIKNQQIISFLKSKQESRENFFQRLKNNNFHNFVINRYSHMCEQETIDSLTKRYGFDKIVIKVLGTVDIEDKDGFNDLTIYIKEKDKNKDYIDFLESENKINLEIEELNIDILNYIKDNNLICETVYNCWGYRIASLDVYSKQIDMDTYELLKY